MYTICCMPYYTSYVHYFCSIMLVCHYKHQTIIIFLRFAETRLGSFRIWDRFTCSGREIFVVAEFLETFEHLKLNLKISPFIQA